MAGRAFAFADPRIIELAKTKFIPVTADDWYQRRRKDDEGEFFRKMADQGPRKGTGGSTRQGIYTFTAAGDLLEFKNAGQDADATLEQLQRALKKWNALPAAKRKPGGIEVPAHGKLDANYSRTPPEGGLIVKVHGRILDEKNGEYKRGTCDSPAGMKASRDFLWLTAADVKAMSPPAGELGVKYSLPQSVARRIARFHLVDNTLGEPKFWSAAEVRECELHLRAVTQAKDQVEQRLEGTVSLKNEKGDRGYEARMSGTLVFDLKTKTYTAFNVVAVGDHWGDDTVTSSGSRPGKTPYGVAFTLADAKLPSHRVSPQAARDWGTYMGKE